MTWMRPREKKRDAILGHVASWGDRRPPMARITAKPARPVNALVGFVARHDRIKLAFTQFLFAARQSVRPPRPAEAPARLCGTQPRRGARTVLGRARCRRTMRAVRSRTI